MVYKMCSYFNIALWHQYSALRAMQSKTFKPPLTEYAYGQRSFQYSKAHLWNQLPSNIRECSSLDQFKSLLKSHLFVK